MKWKESLQIRQTEDDNLTLMESASGKLRIAAYTVYPGITLQYITSHVQNVTFPARPRPDVFAINHCEKGRIECHFQNGEYLYMGKGDMSIGWRDSAGYCHSAFFPSSHYHGVSLIVHVPEAQPVLDRLLTDDSLDLSGLCNRFCHHSRFGMILEENTSMRHLFYELYHVPEPIRKRYLRLKVMEILLFLTTLEPVQKQNQIQLNKKQADAVKEIHYLLTQHVKERLTINELAQRGGLAATTLKRCFKEMYGKTIFQYMQEYRVSEAARLLIEGEGSIMEIAARVGYENSSKFAKAFQKFTGLTPSVYRQKHKS